jgi:hypothetical protein
MDYTTKRVSKNLADAFTKLHDGDWAGVALAAECARVLAEGLQASRHVLEALGSNTPIGYDTAVGYVSKVAPNLFTLIDPVDLVRQHEPELIDACLTVGASVASVSAPPALVGLGVDNCHAFPLWVLRKHYGV